MRAALGNFVYIQFMANKRSLEPLLHPHVLDLMTYARRVLRFRELKRCPSLYEDYHYKN